MAYFDSPKNRAIWEIELEDLKKKRSIRDQEGYQKRSVDMQEKQGSQTRWSISYEELLEEEARMGRQKRGAEPGLQKSKETKAPVREKAEKGLER